MGVTVFVEDFDPKGGCWNRVLVLPVEEFDSTIKYESKYGGIIRIRYVGEEEKGLPKSEVNRKSLTEEEPVVTMESDELSLGEEIVTNKPNYKKSKKKKTLFFD